MNPLIDYAIKNIWCAPAQDGQFIFRPARLTAYGGVSGYWRILMTYLSMPELGERFHIYQIGQIHPSLVTLFPKENQWVRLDRASELNNTIYNVYYSCGARVPLCKCYYMVTEEKNLVFAVAIVPDIIQFGKDALPTGKIVDTSGEYIYIHAYRNNYYIRQELDTNLDYIKVHSTRAKNIEDLRQYDILRDDYLTKKGGVLCFRNGYLMTGRFMVDPNPGDWIEIVYDSSIKSISDYKLNQLEVYVNNDKERKYVIPNTSLDSDEIEYHDDVDFYLVDLYRGYGVYLHKNKPDAFKMLTHKTYCVSTELIQSFKTENAGAFDSDHVVIRAHIRHGGTKRKLAMSSNRVNELYKLGAADITQAMTGINSVVDVWKAANLESSGYTKLMWDKTKIYNKSEVAKAIGYDGCSKIIGQAVHKVEMISNQPGVLTPEAYFNDCTGFEYDENGLLLGWNYHVSGSVYNCIYPQCKVVEFIRGKVSDQIDDTYNQPVQLINPNYDYRFYIQSKLENPQTSQWIDVSGDNTKYIVQNDTLQWLVDSNWRTIVRSNKVTLLQKWQYDIEDGIIQFNITSKRLVNSTQQNVELEIPMGELDVFLNGRNLIKGLDYYVSFPTITIVNKEFISYDKRQEIIIRYKGLSTVNLNDSDTNEFGFIFGGRISVDKQYDIKDNKVLRIVVGGKLLHNEDVIFQEDSSTFDTQSLSNGLPYCIKDLVIPMKDYTGLDTYNFRENSLVVNKQISQYLTEKIDQSVDKSIIAPQSKRWIIFSPFLSKIIMDLKNGIINPELLGQNYEYSDMLPILERYKYLLNTDPINHDLLPNPAFVEIHPHCYKTQISLTAPCYIFIEKIVRTHARNLLTLSTHITVA